MPYIDLRVHVDAEYDEVDDYTHHTVIGVERTGTDLDANTILGIQETLAQSDWGQIEFPAGVNEALGGKTADLRR